MKLGAARQKAPSAWRLVEVKLAEKEAGMEEMSAKFRDLGGKVYIAAD